MEQPENNIDETGQNQQKSNFDKKIQKHQQNEIKAATDSDSDGIPDLGYKTKFAFSRKKPYILSEELALEQIELLFDRCRIDIPKIAEKDLEQAEAIEVAAEIVLEAVRLGEIEFYIDDASGIFKTKQHIQYRSAKGTVKTLIYSEVQGSNQSDMPTGKKINEYARMQGLLGSMCELPQGASYVKSLRSSDAKTAVALSTLFLV